MGQNLTASAKGRLTDGLQSKVKEFREAAIAYRSLHTFILFLSQFIHSETETGYITNIVVGLLQTNFGNH